MTYRSVFFIFSCLVIAVALAMLAPAAVDYLAGDTLAALWFFGSSMAFLFLGAAGVLSTRTNAPISLSFRDGVLLTTLSWVALCLICAVPLEAAGLRYIDALFETVSGITTTGSTVISGLDNLSAGVLLWRSILQWLGGIGIVVMAILLLPFLKSGGMQLFKLESSNRSDKPVARTGHLIRMLMSIYCGLTALCAVSYAAVGMSGFDALNHAMTTVATGGYSTHDASFGYFDGASFRAVGTVFMLAGALPFLAYVRALNGPDLKGFSDSQVVTFLLMVSGVICGLSLWLWAVRDMPFGAAASQVSFNIVSVVTTTGYASNDYSLWGPLAVATFFVLTLSGGCAGSTTGGIKIYRFEILYIFVRSQLRVLYAPRQVHVATYNGRTLGDDIPLSVLAFLGIFFAVAGLATVMLAATGLDLMTALTGSLTALANVGPGLGEIIGPSGNFSSLPDAAKGVLMIVMLLGRLEIFVVLVLLQPDFWRR